MRNLLIAAAASVLMTMPSKARDLAEPFNKDGQGIVLKGYDPVAYFEQGRRVKDSPQFTHH